MVIDCPGSAGPIQVELVDEDVAETASEPPRSGRVAGPAGCDLAGPIEPLGVEPVAVLIAQMTALMLELQSEGPSVQTGSGIEANHPIVTDESALGVTQTEPSVNFGPEAQGDRPAAAPKREHRHILSQRDLGLGFPPEVAFTPAGRDEAADKTVHPGRGLRKLEARNPGKNARLTRRAFSPTQQQREHQGHRSPDA